MPKPKYDHPVIQKGAVQVFAHLAQKPMSPELKEVRTPPVVTHVFWADWLPTIDFMERGTVLACAVCPGTPNMYVYILETLFFSVKVWPQNLLSRRACQCRLALASKALRANVAVETRRK